MASRSRTPCLSLCAPSLFRRCVACSDAMARTGCRSIPPASPSAGGPEAHGSSSRALRRTTRGACLSPSRADPGGAGRVSAAVSVWRSGGFRPPSWPFEAPTGTARVVDRTLPQGWSSRRRYRPDAAVPIGLRAATVRDPIARLSVRARRAPIAVFLDRRAGAETVSPVDGSACAPVRPPAPSGPV